MNLSVLQNVICINIVIRIWSGMRRIQKEDLMDAAGQLPPDELVTLGSKRLMSPKKLAPFQTIRVRVER